MGADALRQYWFHKPTAQERKWMAAIKALPPRIKSLVCDYLDAKTQASMDRMWVEAMRAVPLANDISTVLAPGDDEKKLLDFEPKLVYHGELACRAPKRHPVTGRPYKAMTKLD